MFVTRDIDTFAKKNIDELKKIFTWKTKISSPDIIEDSIQDFFLWMQLADILDKFNPRKSGFDTYITTCFLRRISVVQLERNRLKRGNKINQITFDDRIHGGSYNPNEDLDIVHDWNIFTSSIFNSPKIKKTRKKVLRLLLKGFSCTEISEKLGLTNQAVNFQILYLKKEWKKFYR